MVRIRAWDPYPAHWDLPGGRMDPGETFEQTLMRELQEEIGIGYEGTPRQLSAMQTPITIPVGDARVPLVFVIYEAQLPAGAVIQLDPDSNEEVYEWFDPAAAIENMAVKFSPQFIDLVSKL